LFPTLRDFGEKSWVGRAIGVFSVPAVLVLTLTLPVVEGSDMEGGVSLPTHMDEPLQPTSHSLSHSLPLSQSASSDGLSPKEVIHVESEISRFSPALTAAQCVFGPAFCVSFVFGDSDQLVYLFMATVLAGLVGAVGVINAAEDGKSPGWRLVRCMAGFGCSMVWIAAIANEVVSVLLAIGEIMGLSEAIIGLTSTSILYRLFALLARSPALRGGVWSAPFAA
jgi:sodium/potassium/calcium exchanger 6